ncbi:MAG TPA: BON domain-containing protein [Rariglobus sp.]|nr:BON domain-containing protein [Rariglobus sp.]
MKTTYLLPLPLIALFFVGCSKKTEPEVTPPASKPTISDRAENAYEKTKEAAVETKDAIADKLVEWKLTPSDIKDDLQKSGRVVRDKTVAAGEKVGGVIDNARLVTVINGKYVADKDLSALKINVDASEGVVTLKGTVASVDLIGRAVALALNTEGVIQVVSLLTVDAGETSAGKM